MLCFNYFSAGTVFRRQILTSKDGPRTERVKREHSYSVKLNDLDFVFTELANTMKMGEGVLNNLVFTQ